MADNIIITGIDETRGLYDEYVMECQSAGITPMSYDAWYDDLWNWNSAEDEEEPQMSPEEEAQMEADMAYWDWLKAHPILGWLDQLRLGLLWRLRKFLKNY